MISVRIGELVLDGFPRSQRYLIAEAAQEELRRLLATHGLTPARVSQPIAPLELQRGERAVSIGARVGAAVFASLGGTAR